MDKERKALLIQFPEIADLPIEEAFQRDKAAGKDPFAHPIITEMPKLVVSRNGLKLPPFARSIRFRKPEIRLFAGPHAWDQATDWHRTTRYSIACLPPGADPQRYDWTFTAGRIPLLFDSGLSATELRCFLVEVLAAQALRIVHLSPDSGITTYVAEMPK